MKKSLLYLIITSSLIPFGFSQTQTGTLKGQILDNNKNPLPGAVIKLADNVTGTISDQGGYYSLANVPTGKQKVFINFVGFENVIKRILVKPGINELGEITLIEAVQSLEQVVVTATRKEADLEKVPVPIQIVSKEEIQKSAR